MLNAGASSPIEIPEYETQFQPLPDDDDNLYDAIEIIKERRNLYLVRWAGNDPATQKPWEPSWVPKHDCTNDLIHEWKVAKATKAAARAKNRQDDRNFVYGTTSSKKPSKRRHLKGKSKSSTDTSHKPSSVPGSRPPSNFSSGKNSAVVEIIRPKKRPREKFHSEVDSAEGEEEPPVPTRKKRKLLPPSPHEEEESFQQSTDEYSHRARPRSSVDERRIAAWSQEIHPNDPVNDDDLAGRKSRRPDRTHFQLTTQELDRGMPNEDDQMIIVESRTPEPNSDHRSPSLPSPRALISASARNASIVVPETQPSSPPLLQLKTQRSDLVATSPPTTKHRDQALEEDAAVSLPSAELKRNAPRELHPLPRISPSKFLPHLPATTLSNSRFKGLIPPSSQISAIEEFTSPRKSMRYGTQDRPKKPSSRRQDKEEYESYGDHLANNVQDPIEEDEEMPPEVVDVPTFLNGERHAVAQRRTTKRPRSEVHSNQLSPNSMNDHNLESDDAIELASDVQQKGYNKPSAGLDNSNLPSEASRDVSLGHSGPVSNPRVGNGAKDSDHGHRHTNREEENIPMFEALEGSQSMGEEQDSDVFRSSIKNENSFIPQSKREVTEELGLEDVPDGRGAIQVPPGEVNAIISSSAESSSVAATGPWTQNSRLQIQDIKSTTRQLDRVLSLSHQKSEEIGELKQDRMVLQDKVENLQARLWEIEKQYGEVSETPAQEEKLVKLLQENKRLTESNKLLESDKDLMRDLYSRASNAHQEVLAENNALLRDNKSLREQATAGVKQAGLFWKTQVRTLETELARVRGTVKIFTDQAQRTDDEVRRRAGLLPMAQRDALDALEKIERLKDKIRELGRENTSLRIEIKDWEDEAMARRKAEREKRYEESIGDEMVWVCQWINTESRAKCAALFESREELQEHFHKVGHI